MSIIPITNQHQSADPHLPHLPCDGQVGCPVSASKWGDEREMRLAKKRLHFHKPYLIGRLEKARPHLPPSDLLFREIQDRGYRGTTSEMETFLATTYKGRSTPKVLTYLHRNYLVKKVTQARQHAPSAVELCKQIQNRGYRGSLRTVQKFVSQIQKSNPCPKTHFAFHKQYLIEKIKKSQPRKGLAKELLQKIQKRGYEGKAQPIYRLLVNMDMMSTYSKALLHFHRGYLIERMRETRPHFVSPSVLFTEIQARGYRGSLSNLYKFLALVRRGLVFEEINTGGYGGALHNVKEVLTGMGSDGSKSPRIPQQHKDYLIKRLEENQFYGLSTPTLFKEIQARGYRGSLSTVRNFVAPIRKEKCPKHFGLDFHKHYLTGRIKKQQASPISGTQLFREIRAKGYRGSLKTVQGFATKIRKKHASQTASLSFHKEYLAKRVEETWPYVLTGRELYREIQAKGYRGSLKPVQTFLHMIRS